MSAPVEPAPATSAEANLPKKPVAHFEAFGIRLPLPRWAIFCIGILAILGSGASVSLKFLPQLNSGAAQSSVNNPASPNQTPVPLPPAQGNKVSDVDMIQYREAWKHRDETPRITSSVLRSPDLGSLEVNFFISDGCVRIKRTSPGNAQPVSLYVPAASINDQSPGKIDNARAAQTQARAGGHRSAESQILLASFAVPSVAETSEAAGNCWSPHPGEFRWWNGETRGCWLQVWRAWPDNCQHYQWFNTCNGYWDSEPNGVPRVFWTSCNH